jgi:prepilin-type N-terminal cleavage/methylation domain-containing protein
MRKQGFTIIEMLIVIAIIAVLVGMALPRLRSMQMEGDYAKAAGELRTLQAGVESYYIHNTRAYPDQAEAVATDWQTSLTAATPQIISAALADPFDPSRAYGWATSAAASSEFYVIFSVGPDRTADITGISTAGAIEGGPDDDIYVSNGQSGASGF